MQCEAGDIQAEDTLHQTEVTRKLYRNEKVPGERDYCPRSDLQEASTIDKGVTRNRSTGPTQLEFLGYQSRRRGEKNRCGWPTCYPINSAL